MSTEEKKENWKVIELKKKENGGFERKILK